MSLLQSVRDGFFSIIAECTPHNAREVRHAAHLAKGLVELNKKYEARKIRFAALSLTQSPGGSLSYDHLASLMILRESGMPAELELIPHVTGKDLNRDALTVLLKSLAENGVGTVLAFTGDKSIRAEGVFEVDSLGVLELIRSINVERLQAAKDYETFCATPLLHAGAAVSPFKYTEGSLAMQHLKAAKKIREGAGFLVCQAGWDANRSEHLIRNLPASGTPLLGNVLVVNEAAAKYMQGLAGCVVEDAFIERLKGETEDDFYRRAGQQLAMFRDLGYAGVDLGKPGEFKSAAEIERVLDAALEVEDWRAVKGNITFAPAESPMPRARKSAAVSRAVHGAVLGKGAPLHKAFRGALVPFNRSQEKGGALYHFFNFLEGVGKGMLYQCEHCGDCFLPENQYLCTKGECEKGLNNPPCGDADPAGRCGNNVHRICVAERLYQRVLDRDAMEEFRGMTLPPRDPALKNTASVLNYVFDRDHTARTNPLEGSGMIQIGELLHASIPFPGAIMRYVQERGERGFEEPNRGLACIEDLIRTQARQGAAYINVNIDNLGAPDAPDLMRRFVRCIHRIGEGVPPCVDSSDPAVLQAGLEEWFGLGDGLRPPLVNSITAVEFDKYAPLCALRKDHAFSAVCLLLGPTGPFENQDLMVDNARIMFDKMMAFGFEPEELFFDAVTLGIGTNGCIDPSGMTKGSHTHHSFHAIQRIREDAEMRGVHCVLGVSNWVYGAKKRRIGHVRAFIAVAREYGLDAAIVDVAKRFGIEPAAPELVDFVRMFVSLDGGEDAMTVYAEKMAEMREKNWI